MKTLLLAATALVLTVGQASAQSLPNFKLACESNSSDRQRVWLEVLPQENVVKMVNEKNENFSFPITDLMPLVATANNYNVFGHSNPTKVWFAASITFQDLGGKDRYLRKTIHPDYVYSGGEAGRGWAYDCLLSSPSIR